jgi:L-2-hydroxyglutarate oxidase LhgO
MRKRKSPNTKVYVIIGGGVSAVSCAQELRRIVGVDIRVLIITATELIKDV